MSSISIENAKPQSHWWVVLIQGIAAIFLGVLLLTQPAGTIATLVLFLGIYWLVSGVMTLISLLWNRDQWGLKLITGIIGIIAGLFIVQNPIISAFVVPAAYGFMLGILGIFMGISQLIQAFRGGGWGVGVLGVLSIILGILLVTNPVIAGLSLAVMLGFLLIIGGIVALFAAFRLRSANKAYEAAQAQASRSASVAGSKVGSTAGSTAGSTGNRAAGAVGAVGAGAASVAGAAVSRAGDGVEQAATGAVDAVSDGAKSAAGGVAGTAAGTAAAVSRAGDGLEQTASGAVAGTAAAVSRAGNGLEGAGIDAAETVGEFADNAGDAVRDTAGDVAGLAAAGVDAAQDAGGAIADVFTGNVNPLDAEEMSKYKYPLEFIEGVGQASADKLRAVGINNCLELLKRGYTAKGRTEIAAQSGISGRSILTWVNHVDLYRIKGVGSEYADLLEASGVDTVVELAQRNAANLFTRMNDLNAEKKLVRKTPTMSQVQDWVAQAKSLPRIITY